MDDFDEQFERELEAMKDDGSIIEITEDGMIHFNFELLEILHPALYDLVWEDVNREIDQSLRSLVDQGLIAMSFQEKEDGQLEEVFQLTEEGKQYVEAMVDAGLAPPFPLPPNEG